MMVFVCVPEVVSHFKHYRYFNWLWALKC